MQHRHNLYQTKDSNPKKLSRNMVHRSLFNLALLGFLAGVSGFASTSEYGVKNTHSRQQPATALKMVDRKY